MRTLALETSTRIPQFALCDGTDVVASHVLEPSQSTAGDLVPAIEQGLVAAGWRSRDIELIAVSRGPGSFTGLRVGLTIAKTWAHVTGADLVAVDTFAVLAAQVPSAPFVSPVIPAQRGHIFATLLELASDGDYESRTTPAWREPADWLKEVPRGTLFTGPGVPLLQQVDSQLSPVADSSSWTPTAETVARLGARAHTIGRLDDPLQVAPYYLRPSAAEEKAGR